MNLQNVRDSLTNSDTMKMSLVESSGNVVEQKEHLVDVILTQHALYLCCNVLNMVAPIL